MDISTLAGEYQAAHRVLDADAETWLARGVRRLVESGRARWEPDHAVPGCVGLREVEGDRGLLIVVWVDRADFESGWRLEDILGRFA